MKATTLTVTAVIVALLGAIGSSSAHNCRDVKANEMDFCYMVDYPVFTVGDMTLQDADNQAEFQYQSHMDQVVENTNLFNANVDCANAFRAHRCAYVAHRCSADRSEPTGPCKDTCEKFYRTCYKGPDAEQLMKMDCEHLPTKGCTRIAIPPPPPPPFQGDKPPKDGFGLESIIYKDTFKIPVLGECIFGVKNLTMATVNGDLEIMSKGRKMGIRAENVAFEAEIQYFFIQKGFPWIKSAGSLKTKSGLLEVFTMFEFDSVTKKFVIASNNVKLNAEFTTLRTGMQWIKNAFLDHFKGWLNKTIAGPITDFMKQLVTEILPDNFGSLFATAPFNKGTIKSKVAYNRNEYVHNHQQII